MKRSVILAGLFTIAAIGMSSHLDAVAAPKQMPDGETFDAEYYAANNPDVTAVLGTDEALLYRHYQIFGKAEGRLPFETGSNTAALRFDAAYYAANNPDVVAVLGTDPELLYQHWLQYGKQEGRKGSASDISSLNTSISFDASVTNYNTFVQHFAKQGFANTVVLVCPNGAEIKTGIKYTGRGYLTITVSHLGNELVDCSMTVGTRETSVSFLSSHPSGYTQNLWGNYAALYDLIIDCYNKGYEPEAIRTTIRQSAYASLISE